MTILLDDHLLRDWMVGPDRDLVHAVAGESLATTNLWYARLCKSAARSAGGALLGDLTLEERQGLVAGPVTLPDEITIVPMRELAWRMAVLVQGRVVYRRLGQRRWRLAKLWMPGCLFRAVTTVRESVEPAGA